MLNDYTTNIHRQKAEQNKKYTEAGITKGTLTGVLKTLEGLGLTQKQPHNTDGRRRIIEVTSKGKRIFRRLLPRFNELETSVTRGLSNKNKGEVVKALRLILQQTEKS